MFARTATAAVTNTADRGEARPRAGLAQRLAALLRPQRGEPIGLDVANEKLHMVQFESSSRPPLVRAAISLAYEGSREALLSDTERFKALVKRALARRPFRGSSVVSCLPQPDIRIMTMAYHRAAGEDDTVAIVKSLRERIKGELDESVVDYVAVHGDDAPSAERSAIVAVARRDRVVAYLELLRGAGLEVTALDIGPAALARLVSTLGDGTDCANALLVNFGQGKSYMSVIWGRRLMLDRDIDFSEGRLVARLEKILNIPGPEALRLLYQHGYRSAQDAAAKEITQTLIEVLRADFAALAAEINKTLIYTASKTRGLAVERIYLLGSVARHPGIADLIQGLVAVPVKVINPFDVFAVRQDATVLAELDPIAGIGLATGLALRGSDDSG